MIATAALAEAGFRTQAVAKWRAVYWMTAALVAPVMNAVFFTIPPSVEIY
ncbi:hypothetical protein [uncultured Campylobacter sp.]|nr:hypothetical protein [uncultured Campylobacter sp.]